MRTLNVKHLRSAKKVNLEIANALEKRDSLKLEVADATDRLRNCNKLISDLVKIQNKLKEKKDLEVTEHALVRYFERVEGYDINQVKKRILSQELIDQINTLGESGTYVSNGIKCGVKNKTITTILK